VEELCERGGATNVKVICADASGGAVAGEGYDRVLVDPPCSDLGTLASRPDARWRKAPETIAALAEVQSRILAGGAEALRPGGTIVYSTCTISERENAAVIEASGMREVRRLETRPDRDGTDGFFIAEFRADG
jgi:16S rRNA (cytosine967-C5)-methyltransferase